jgi:hypothetical protein
VSLLLTGEMHELLAYQCDFDEKVRCTIYLQKVCSFGSINAARTVDMKPPTSVFVKHELSRCERERRI